METTQVKPRLTPDELKKLKAIAESCGINATTLAGIFIKAGMRAAIANGDKIPLPLNFQIMENLKEAEVHDRNRLNEQGRKKNKANYLKGSE